ncbi:MAG: adenosine deaminase [Spirochaetes bacterium GWD1_27_9]|nr:MAG: adenosine deaminase [Spirochaetes bacterium GWB1_27_13]OHD26194.1 MAG: adenosine deaminase [Spirochaetes bacterium GWC1_27_15]OHD35749.1 MAG: adenosine deaminase [Spirochaetes bacterium GWD1_27_9]
MDKKEFYKFFKKIPKAEIHLHSEGIISKETAGKMLSRKHPEFKNSENIENLFSYNNLKEFIKAFLLIQKSFEELSDFKALFNNISTYLKRNGIVYTELFFSPSLFVKNGWKFENMMDVFLKKIKKIKRKEKIEIKIIIDVSRTFGVDNAMKNLDALLKYKNKNIIGIGLGGDELKGPAKDFAKIFTKAKDAGVHRVAHAGEDDGPQSVWDAINLLYSERIGHGISSIQDESLIEYLSKEQIPLEICPTSNIFTKKYVQKIEDHPIKEFYKKGVLVTVNTDDPTFFNINLIDEYWNLYTKLGFDLSDLKQIIINGFKSSFLSKVKKERYIKKVNCMWKKYLPKNNTE